MAPRKKPADVAVIPVERGVNEAGTPFVKAMVVKSNPATPIKSKVTRDYGKSFYKQNQLAEPVYNPRLLEEFMTSMPYHSICVNKKARLVAGVGFKIITSFDEGASRVYVRSWDNADKDGRKKLDKKKYAEHKDKIEKAAKQRERLRAWIDEINNRATFREIVERGWADWEAFGSANWEILRNGNGEPVRLNHVPAVRLRVTKDGERIALINPVVTPGSGLQVGMGAAKPVFFKFYNDPRHLNSDTGEFRPWKGDWENPTDKFDGGEDWGDKEANEILRYVSYSSRDPLYGIPAWLAALGDMLGLQESRDFVLKFFTDKAVPMYAVIMEGGSWNDETITTIQQFFRQELAGDYHATLALEVPEGGKVTFEQISPDQKWWPFILKYRESVRDILISVHGLSPALAGIVESGNIGGGTGEAQMETVKTTEIKPRQETLEWLINTFLVKRGLDVDLAVIKFDEIDTQDETQVVGAVTQLYSTPPRPTITTNEARQMLRKPPIDAEWADEILIQDPQFGLLPLSQISEAFRQNQKAQQMAAAQAGAMPGQEGAPPGQPPQDAELPPEALASILAQAMQEDDGKDDSETPPAGEDAKKSLRRFVQEALL